MVETPDEELHASHVTLDQLRQVVRGCLLPGAEMPSDEDGLFGRVDAEGLDKGLKQLRTELRSFVPTFPKDSRHDFQPLSLDSLQLIASLWPRADEVRKVVTRRLENPTIKSIEASIRRGTRILSHVPGHELQAPAMPKNLAIKRVVLILFGPLALSLLAIIFSHFAVDRRCELTVRSLQTTVLEVLPFAAAVSGVVLSYVALPGIVATLSTPLNNKAR